MVPQEATERSHLRLSAASRLWPEEQMGELTGRTVGHYLLREQIGDGGYGDVYRAEHQVLKRIAVVKVLNKKRQEDDHAGARLLKEAQLASQLSHTNAAHVYDFGVAEEDGLMWIAMEFVDGLTLAAWLAAHGPMALGELVPFFERLAEVVDAMHQCGIVHRDLKPSNIMVIESNGPTSPGTLMPKLLDFGIAKAIVGSLAEAGEKPAEAPRGDKVITELIRPTPSPRRLEPTKTGATSGQPRRITRSGAGFGSQPYMSPEHWWNASNAGRAADIYSLGIIVFEALTGRLPFTANSAEDYCLQHCLAAVPTLGDGFSSDLDAVLSRALAKEPKDRHANVLEFAAELRAVLRLDPHEQIRSLTRRWQERGQSRDLLARGQVLAELKRSVQRPRVAQHLSALEFSFIAKSLRRARHVRWGLATLVALAVMSVVVVRAEVQAGMADQFANETETERGQQALLHGESSEAVRHLESVYQRGQRSPGVAFMLARALQPRMSEIARLNAGSGRMWSATFTVDGKRVLTTDDTSARMWDAESGQPLFTMSHGDIVYQAVFSPDNAQVITAGGDGTVRIWSATTGAPIRTLTDPRRGAKQWRYYSVAMSANFVAAIDLIGKAARVWDAETGIQVAELENDASELSAVAFSSDGRWLATTGGDEVRVFDTSTWERRATLAGPRVRSMSFDPSGQHIAIGTYDGIASIWEIPNGVRIRYLREGGESVDAIAFSRDGQLMATGSRDGQEQVWNATSGGLRSELRSHRGKIYAVEFSPDGKLMLSAGADGAVVVSSVSSGMPAARLEGPTSLVFTARFDQTSGRVVGASFDGTARVWHAASPYLRWNSSPIGPECENMDSLVPDQRFVAVSCRNRGTNVWDTVRGALVAELPAVTSAGDDYFSAFPALTTAGDRAAIARGNTVEIYALPSGQLLRKIAHAAAVNAVAFAPAGHDLVTGAVDGSLLLTRDDAEPFALPGASAGIDAAALLGDGRVISADASNRLRVIAPGQGALLMDVAAPSRIRLLRPSLDGKRMITISTRNKQMPPVLWDLGRHQLLAQLDGHVGRVFTARFVADGREILTAGADGTARLWSAETGEPRRVFQGDSHFLADATVTPDGASVVAGGSDGLVRFWDAANGRLLWTLQAHKSYVIGLHYEGSELVTRGFAGDVARWSLPRSEEIIEACHAVTCTSSSSSGK